MSNTIDQNIQIKCPGLFGDANKQLWINNAQLSINQECYGEKYNLAVALRACHDYTVSTFEQSNIGGGAGAIISKREGDQSVSFASTSSQNKDDAYLNQTAYGRELLSIQKGTLPRINNTEGDIISTAFCCTY